MPMTTRGRAAPASTNSDSAFAESGTQRSGQGSEPGQRGGGRGRVTPTSPGRDRSTTSPSRARATSPLKPKSSGQAAKAKACGKAAGNGERQPLLSSGLLGSTSRQATYKFEDWDEPGKGSALQPSNHGLLDGSNGHADGAGGAAPAPIAHEWWNMVLLVLLYMMQGVPLGLTTGALPFMLQSKLTYTQVGIFSLSAYPYSLKLLWSPIVDSCFSPRFGRRKSWIVPVQLATAAMLILCSGLIQNLYDAADVNSLTALFLVFVFLAATQDIAVDGWALTLLSPANVAYASTCQTIGVTLGYFTSFTVFLALNNGAFCDIYLRTWVPAWLLGTAGQQVPLVTLPGYLTFWGWVFALATVGIAALQPEKNFTEEEERERDRRREDAGQEARATASEAGAVVTADGGKGSVRRRATAAAGATPASASALAAGDAGVSGGSSGGGGVLGGALQEVVAAYGQLWCVVKLPAVWGLSAFLLTYRLGVQSTEAAYSLKLIDKGVSKEALAFLVLFQFPIELGTAVLAGRWATNHSPYGPFITGYLLRLVVAAAMLVLTAWFPAGATSLTEHAFPFGLLAAASLLQSFATTLSFTALGSFFNRISDPVMGGAYLTLLNTIANMGYLLPRTPLFWVIDVLTVPRCTAASPNDDAALLAQLVCPKKAKDMATGNACTDAGGVCELVSDGFYIISWSMLVVGVVLGVAYVRLLPWLMQLPLAKWRVTAAAPGARSS